MEKKQTMKKVYKYANNTHPKSGRNKNQFPPLVFIFKFRLWSYICFYNNNFYKNNFKCI